MRELAWQMGLAVSGYVDITPPGRPVTIGTEMIPYLGDDEFLLRRNIAIADGKYAALDKRYNTRKMPILILEHHSPARQGLLGM